MNISGKLEKIKKIVVLDKTTTFIKSGKKTYRHDYEYWRHLWEGMKGYEVVVPPPTTENILRGQTYHFKWIGKL